MRTFTLVFIFGMCVSCNYIEIEAHPCPPSGTDLTYENFGKPFLARWCQGCHGTSERAGAPTSFDFGTPELAREHRARIFARSAASNTTMPPGPDDPSADERAKLADWLACGAP